MGKRKNEQPAGKSGEFHVPKAKRSLGGDSEAPGHDGKATAATGQTDERGQTTDGSAGSANREAAAAAATQPELPQRGDSVREEEEGSVDEKEEDAPGRCGCTGDAETQTHRGMGDNGDGHECPREAAGAAVALPGHTGVAGTHHEEEGEHGELGDTDRNREPPGVCVRNAEGSERGATSEQAVGGETRGNGAEQPRATGTSDAESCGSPGRLGVCAPAAETEGGTAGVGREETTGGETPSPGAGSVPDPAIAAGGSPTGEGDGECAAESAAGTDTQPPVCCDGTADTAPAVTVTPVPASTAEPPSVDSSIAEPTGVGTSTMEPPSTAERPGVGTSTAEPPSVGSSTAEPPRMGTGTAEPHGEGTGTTESPSTTEPPSMGTGTTEPPGVGTGTMEPPGTTEPPSTGTGTTEPPGMGTDTAVGTETPGESCVAMEPLPPQSKLPPQQPPPATNRHDPAEPAPPGRSHNQEPPHREDATDIVCGLILELSNLNRLAMSTHRGLEMLRRPKPRQSRRPVPPRAGRWWKET